MRTAAAAVAPVNADVVTPGEPLGSAGTYQPGTGTHLLDGTIYASVTGLRRTLPSPSPSVLPLLSVLSHQPPSPVPQPSDVVLARVTKINPRYASLSIVCIGSVLVAEAFPGIIRQRDIRAFDIDNADVGRSYRPGDLVKARVLSLGDARSHFLTTAEVELGVVEAISAAGGPMKPLSYERMECTVTGVKEQRKVAKTVGVEEAGKGPANT